MHNLHISYDLNSPGQNYENLIASIKSLGDWAKIHKSYWFVKSRYSAQQAADLLWARMDGNDTLYVVDPTANNATWRNLSEAASNYIRNSWNA